MDLGERALGPDHPLVAKSLVQLGRHTFWNDGPDAARPILTRAFEIQRTKLGEDHPDIATTMNLLGMFEHPGERAFSTYQAAVVVIEKEYGPMHPHIVPPLFNIAEVHAFRREFELALPPLTRACEIRGALLGTEDGHYLGLVALRLVVLMELGQRDLARELLGTKDRRSSKWLRDAREHCYFEHQLQLTELELRAGDFDAADAAMQGALGEAERCPDGRERYAKWAHYGDWVHARVLWHRPRRDGDGQRAVELAKTAARRWRDLPPPKHPQWANACELWCTNPEREIARIEAWLAEMDPR